MGLRVVNGVIVEGEVSKPHVKFITHPRKVGIGKFEDTPYIQKRGRGCRDGITRKATEEDKAEFPEEWAAYQSGESLDGGTLLNALPAWTKAIELELDAIGIDSVEALAKCDELPVDADGNPLHEARKLITQAKRYVQLEAETSEE